MEWLVNNIVQITLGEFKYSHSHTIAQSHIFQVISTYVLRLLFALPSASEKSPTTKSLLLIRILLRLIRTHSRFITTVRITYEFKAFVKEKFPLGFTVNREPIHTQAHFTYSMLLFFSYVPKIVQRSLSLFPCFNFFFFILLVTIRK